MVVTSLSQGAALDEAVMGITLRCVNASVSNKEPGKAVNLKNRLGRIRQRVLDLQTASLDSEAGLGQSFLGRRRLVRMPHLLTAWFRDEVRVQKLELDVSKISTSALVLFSLFFLFFFFLFSFKFFFSGVLRVGKRKIILRRFLCRDSKKGCGIGT